MAYYRQIETRFGETYTVASDNFSDFVNDSTIPLQFTDNEIVFSSNTHIQWDGDIGSTSDTDMIAFNRVFRFGEDSNTLSNRRLTGQSGANSGKHAYFVNCTFYFDGAQENAGSNKQPLLGASSDFWDVSRERTIPTAKSGNGTFNFYNCKFIFNMHQGDVSNASNATSGIVCGDIVDCTFLNINPNSSDFVFYPQPGAMVTGNATDFPGHTSSSLAGGSIWQLDGAGPEAFEDNSLQNYYIYPVNPSGLFEFPFLDITQTVDYVQPGGGAAPDNPPVIRTQDFGSSFTNTSVLASPKVNLQLDGNIYWRNSRNGASNNRPRVVASRRFERTAYTTPAQTEGRANLKYLFRGNVNYTTAGEAHTIAVNTSDVDRTYITDSDGALTGTYNFIDGSSSASTEVKTHIDVPISYFRADAPEAVAATSDFKTEQFNFSTTLTAISWNGQVNYTTIYDSDEWAANDSDAATRDGFWIRRDNVNEVDVADEHIADYDTPSDAADLVPSDGTGTLTANDVYAVFKYAVYQQDRATNKFVDVENYPYDFVSNGTFDMSTLPADGSGVDLQVSNSSTNAPYGFFGNEEFRMRIASFDAAETGDTITKIKANTISLNRRPCSMNIESTNTQNLQRFDGVPDDIDSDYSFKDNTVGGTVTLDPSGSLGDFIFNNVSWEDGTTVTKSGTNTARAFLVNGTSPVDGEGNDVFDSSVNEVLGVANITVNFETAISDSSDITFAFLRSADGATFTDATVESATLAADGMSATYEVFYDASESGSQLYFAVVADQHRMARGTVTSDTTVNLESFTTAVVNDNYTPSGTDEIRLRDNPFAVTEVTDGDAQILVNSPYTTAGVSVASDMARYAIRLAERSDNWMEAVAKNFIPPNYLDWRENAIIFNESNVDRIVFSHSSSDYLWDLRTRVENANAESYYSALSTDISETYIQFAPTTNGASVSELVDQLNELKEELFTADTDSSNPDGYEKRGLNRNLTVARQTKNAVFAK